MSLQKFLVLARLQLHELNVQSVLEARLAAALNEGKNELVKILRRAREDYFETYALLTVPIAAPLDPSEIELPADFATLKDLQIKTAGYEDTEFMPMDRADSRFRDAVIRTRFGPTGCGFFYYDVTERGVLKLSPGSDVVLSLKVVYSQYVYDMALPTDAPNLIPAEHWDYIVTWAVCDVLRTKNDARLPLFLDKLHEQEIRIGDAISRRQIRDPVYVKGYMEEDYA